MATSIRLSRGGSKKRPYYRIVVADSRSPRDGRFIERIGSYNPLLAKDNADRVKIDVERAAHWIGVGAQPTDRVARFLDAAGLKERAVRNNPKKAEPGEKAKERAEEKLAKIAEAEEAARAAEEAAKNMLGKTHRMMDVIRPLRDGVIADFEMQRSGLGGAWLGEKSTGRPRGSRDVSERTPHRLSTVNVTLPKMPFLGVLPSKSTNFFSRTQPFASNLLWIVV